LQLSEVLGVLLLLVVVLAEIALQKDPSSKEEALANFESNA
jgi:hypothetical protein